MFKGDNQFKYDLIIIFKETLVMGKKFNAIIFLKY